MNIHGPPIFFVHLMKVGGFSLISMLRGQYAADEMYPGPPEKDLPPTAYMNPVRVALLSDERKERIRFYSGHLPYSIVHVLPQDTKAFALFRHPVERMISHLRMDRATEQRQGRPPRRLHRIYERPIHPKWTYCNLLVKTFAIQPSDMRGVLEHYPVDGPAYERALANVHQLDFIGLTEDFDHTVGALAARYGWTYNGVRHLNRSPGYPVPEGLLQRIAEENEYDLRLYEIVRNLYYERKRAIAAG